VRTLPTKKNPYERMLNKTKNKLTDRNTRIKGDKGGVGCDVSIAPVNPTPRSA